MSIRIHLNSDSERRLNTALNDLAKASGQTIKEVLVSQMRLLAADLAYVTRPKGRGTGDNKTAMARVIAKVREIYPHPGAIVNELKRVNPGAAARFAQALEKRQRKKAEKIVNDNLPGNYRVGAFDRGALHKAQRFQRRVSEKLIVTAQTRVEAYAKRKARMVGFAKGGFATAARQIGGIRGVPGWATRQKSPGKGSVQGDGKNLTVTIQNDVDYIEQILLKSDSDAAVKSRAATVGKLLKRIQTNKSKKAMRR